MRISDWSSDVCSSDLSGASTAPETSELGWAMSLCDPYEVESALPLGHGAGSRKVRFAPKHSHEGAAAMIEVEWWEYDDDAEMAEAVAGDIGLIIESALDARGRARNALPGGKAPGRIIEGRKTGW